MAPPPAARVSSSARRFSSGTEEELYIVFANPNRALRDDKARTTCMQLGDAAERAHTVCDTSVVLML